MVRSEVVSRTMFRQNETNKLWYWHTKAMNNEIVADGGEGYHNKDDAIRGFFAAQGIPINDWKLWPENYSVIPGVSEDHFQINKYTK